MSPCLFLISYPYPEVQKCDVGRRVIKCPTCKRDLCEDPIPSSPIYFHGTPSHFPFHAQGQTVHINLCRKQLHKCGTLFLSGSGSEASIEDVIGKVSFLFLSPTHSLTKKFASASQRKGQCILGHTWFALVGFLELDWGIFLILTIPVHTLYIRMVTIYDTVWLKTDTNLTENRPNWQKTDTNDWKRTPIDWKRTPIAAHDDHF